MKLLQYRKGFATNSSSTHSIIIANRLTKVVMTGEPLNKGDHCTPGQYGWDCFTLASHKAKMRYLATLIMQNLELPIWMKDAVAFNATGAHVESEDYIDHQSVLALPTDWSGKGLDQEFIKDLVEFVSNEDVMILGGSDNNGSPHPLSACGPEVLKQVPRDSGVWVARKQGSEWTLFCRGDGSKITFTFDDSKVSRARPIAPELIDIKCTNFCPFECAYCYQNSNKQGKHANHEQISYLAYECERHKVFEINFGGGEPTLWPYFVHALDDFRRVGVVPNFTTRSLAWLRDEKLRPEILELCGAFAVSVNNRQEVRELADLVRLHRVEDSKVCIHYVLGSSEDYNLTEILREAHRARFIITLLGWKSVGRGTKGPLHDNSQWLKTIKELHKNNECPQIGVDTTIANEYEKEIKKAGIPDYLFYTEEGKFSIYYDAVEDKWGPSSFCEESEYVQIPREREGFYNQTSELIDAWNKIKPTKGKRNKKNEDVDENG
jgi:hypothetical protein